MKWILILPILLSFNVAFADFAALESKLSDQSFFMQTCLEVKAKNDLQVKYNQKVVNSLLAKTNSSSEEVESLQAASAELKRLSIEATRVVIIAGSIDDSMTLSIELDCDQAVLESTITAFSDTIMQYSTEIRTVKFLAPGIDSIDLIIEIAEGVTNTMKLFYDGRVSIGGQGFEQEVELKHLYQLPFPNGLNEMLYSLQRVVGI